jgi:arylformamidase
LHFGNHLGTHVDFPAHTIKNHKTSSDYPLDFLRGPGVIIEVPFKETSIKKEFIKEQSIMPNDIVFFKTSNSEISKHSPFNEQFVYI